MLSEKKKNKFSGFQKVFYILFQCLIFFFMEVIFFSFSFVCECLCDWMSMLTVRV